jgi:hypothetical protein
MAVKSTKYESDAGTIHFIRFQAGASGDFTNTAPTSSVDSPIRAKLSKSNGEYGLRPRRIVVTREVVFTAPESKTVTISKTIPILTKAIWDGNTTKLTAAIKWQGVDYTVASRQAEDY